MKVEVGFELESSDWSASIYLLFLQAGVGDNRHVRLEDST